jgi:hypothetical protein
MNQPPPPPRCANCGASLSLDDLRGTNCRYCGTALAHHARAAEQAALVNQMLNQQFQARGLAPPVNPIAPYQYGAPPNLPPAQPGFMAMQPGLMFPGQDLMGAANKGVNVAVIIAVVVGVVVVLFVGVALLLFTL